MRGRFGARARLERDTRKCATLGCVGVTVVSREPCRTVAVSTKRSAVQVGWMGDVLSCPRVCVCVCVCDARRCVLALSTCLLCMLSQMVIMNFNF